MTCGYAHTARKLTSLLLEVDLSKYQFVGIFKLLKLKADVHLFDFEYQVRLKYTAPDPISDELVELTMVHSYPRGSDMDSMIEASLHELLRHELNEGYMVDGKFYRKPHPHGNEFIA